MHDAFRHDDAVSFQPSPSQRVQEHYEALPYPPREPADEHLRLLPTHLDHLDQVNTWGFAGLLDLHEPFRVLVAGGGTGDATVFLAEQLRETSASIVHLDPSASALAITRARLQQRQLTNVETVEASLLDLAKLGLGPFNYINCSGVLHHLEDPNQGLLALRSVLAQDGVLGIMLYGRYGRTGIYQMQELMRRYLQSKPPIHGISDELAACKRMLAILPSSNWFARQASELHDLTSGDAGLYDLLLHTQDRAYTVPEIYELLEACNLKLLTFVRPNGGGQVEYRPEHWIREPVLLQRLQHMPLPEQQAFVELFAGSFARHAFYASAHKTSRLQISLDNLQAIPMWSLHFDVDGHQPQRLIEQLRAAKGQNVILEHANRRLLAAGGASGIALLQAINGQRTVCEVIAHAKATFAQQMPNRALSDAQWLEELAAIVESLGLYDWLVLRQHPYWPIRSLQRMQHDLHT